MPAREVRLLRARDCRRVPWKNGRGTTCELALSPDGASFERADFDWRISTARIEESGPFSGFPGFDRTLVITDGAGLCLEHGDRAQRARLRRLEPYQFSGDWPTSCELVRGAVSDFNVFVRRGRFSAEVMAVALGTRGLREALSSSCTLVHSMGGAMNVRVSGEEGLFELAPGDSLLLRGLSSHDEIDVAGKDAQSTLIVVRVVESKSHEWRGEIASI